MEFNHKMYNPKEESGKIFKELKELYSLISKDFDDSYVLYNMLERSILFDELVIFKVHIHYNININQLKYLTLTNKYVFKYVI